MSRIGRKGIAIPSGVSVEMGDGLVTVKGPLGTLEQDVADPLSVKIDGDSLYVTAPAGDDQCRAMHGLTRSLIANAVEGVAKGFEKILEVVGVGYNAKVEERKLTLRIGFCHPVVMQIPQGLDVTTPEPTRIVLKGCDKQLVGQVAARIRAVRPPEPYKGKGIRYADEHVRRKAGKTFVAAG